MDQRVLPQWPLLFWSLVQHRHRKAWKKKVSCRVGAVAVTCCMLAVPRHREGDAKPGSHMGPAKASVPPMLQRQSPQCSLLGWPGVPQPVRSGEAARLPVCACLGARCLQRGRVASSAQGWAGPCAAKTCLRSCLFFQSPPGWLSFQLCLSSPVLLAQQAAGFRVADRVAMWAMGSAPSSVCLSLLCSTLQVGRKEGGCSSIPVSPA